VAIFDDSFKFLSFFGNFVIQKIYERKKIQCFFFRQMAKVQHNKNHWAATTQVTHVSLFCSLLLVMLGCDE
jgi:hypothetical protein